MPTSISSVTLRYLVLSDSYAADNINLLASHLTISGGLNISSTTPATTTVTINNFNISGGVTTFVSIVGMDLGSTTASNVYDIGADIQMVNSTNFDIIVSSTSSIPTAFTTLSI